MLIQLVKVWLWMVTHSSLWAVRPASACAKGRVTPALFQLFVMSRGPHEELR